MWSIEVVSVVSSATVAVAGIVVPVLLRRGDRSHERELLTHQREEAWKAEWWTQRQRVYEEAMRQSLHLLDGIASVGQASAAPTPGPRMPLAESKNPTYDVAPRMDTWGSRAMVDAYRDFMEAALIFRPDEQNEVLLFTGAREAMPALNRTYGMMASLVNRELREGPENAAT